MEFLIFIVITLSLLILILGGGYVALDTLRDLLKKG